MLNSLTRRCVLSSGLAAIGLALATPQASFAGTDPLPFQALTFDDGAIVAASDDGLWRIVDTRATPLNDPGAVVSLTSHPELPRTIYAALRDGGLRRSTDGGESWTKADTSLPASQVLSVTMAAEAPDMLYAMLAGDGLWRSEDAGETWTFVMDRPYLNGAEHDVLSLVSVPSPTGMGGIWLYAGTAAGLTRVPDCFCRWQDVTAGDAMDALAAGKTPAPASPLPAGVAVRNLGLANAAPDQIYAGLETGLWASTDAGVDWALKSPEPIAALAVDPNDPLHVVAARPDGLSDTRDGGASWSLLTFTKEN